MKKSLILLTCGLALAFSSHAQQGGQRNVNKRIQNQDQRIAAGRADGQLTRHEARQLKGEERGIKQQANSERRANGGRLTGGERQQLNQELNQDSRQIHRDRKAGQ